jgi:hypothetical protein
MATGFYSRNAKADIEKTAGAHRFVWDLQHYGPWDKNPSRNGRGGPTARPGQYEIKLTVDGKALSQWVNVEADPRIASSGITVDDLKAQETLALQVRDLQDTTKRVAEKIKSRKKELAKLLKESGSNETLKAENEKLSQLESQLVTAEGTYMTPMILDQLRYLGSMLDRADQRPGKDAYDRYNELEGRLKKVLLEYNDTNSNVSGSN